MMSPDTIYYRNTDEDQLCPKRCTMESVLYSKLNTLVQHQQQTGSEHHFKPEKHCHTNKGLKTSVRSLCCFVILNNKQHNNLDE